MHRVLVAEDDLPIAEMYRFKLEKSGYKVECAHNGEDSLLLAEKFSPHLILLDLKMPLMSGEEVLRRIRQEAWGCNIRVIVLTNISRSEAPSSLNFLKVDRYVVKAHYTPQQVVDMVASLLEQVPAL